MVFAGWLAPHRVLVALVTVTGALACKDTTTPKQVSSASIPDARFTPAVGFVGTQSDRGNLGAFHSKSKAAGYHVDLKSKDDTDIVVTDIVVAPGGHSGWHFHPGPAVVVVKTGTITFYMGDDPTCTARVHPEGTAFIEDGGMVGIARNEGTGEATVVATFFVPKGSPARIDAPRPGNCTF